MAALVAAAAAAPLLGSHLDGVLADVGSADRHWLSIAAALFAMSVVSVAAAWRASLKLCDGRLGVTDACARYGAGCLVNSLLPGGLGGATRVALFSRALDGGDRLWRVGGSAALVSAAKTTGIGVLVAYAAFSGAVPKWPLAIVAAIVAATGITCLVTRRREAVGHASHALDAFRALGRSPRHGAELVGWVTAATAGRVLAAAAIVTAFGVHAPLSAALLIVPALSLAAMMPLTPANVGLSSAAVMAALATHGVGAETALAAGIALNAVETFVSILFGLGSAAYLALHPSLWARRLALGLGGSAACAAVAAVVVSA